MTGAVGSSSIAGIAKDYGLAGIVSEALFSILFLSIWHALRGMA